MSQWNEDNGEEDGEDYAGSSTPDLSGLGLQGSGLFPPSTSSMSSSSASSTSPSSHPLFGPRAPPVRGMPAPRKQLAARSSLTATSSESTDFDRFTDLRDDSSASSSSSPSSAPPVDRGVVQFDFRHGSMPAGVTVHGDAELQLQADRSTALVLSPSAYLRLTLPFAANGAIKAARVNDYSITLDVKSQSPASFGGEGVALYQSKWSASHYDTTHPIHQHTRTHATHQLLVSSASS